MLDILNLTLPFFAVVGIGYFAARAGMVETSAVSSINTFVFYFAMPALVAGTLARQDFSAILDRDLLAGWLLAGLVLFSIGMIFCSVYQSKIGQPAALGEMALTGQAASIANVGFLALPIAAANFGDEGIRISASVLIIDLLVLIPLSITLLETRSGGSRLHAFAYAVGKAIKNPFAIAIILGVALSSTGLGLPEPAERFVVFLGAAGPPTALFALGLSLFERDVESHHAFVGVVTFLKLVVHPIAVFLALSAFGLPTEIIAIAVVIAACPVAQNVFVIAAQYKLMVKRSSAAILISTLAATITVTAILAYINWQ
ncbi:MAG: AEC family transporter [Salaquimonas sp.]